VERTTQELVEAYVASGQEVFHLMGGAPALYLRQWPELILALPPTTIFHSDFLLTEQPYDERALEIMEDFKNCLFAVDIKGTTPEDYEKNTRKPFKHRLFWDNLKKLVDHKINFYITYTNPDEEYRPVFEYRLKYNFGASILEDSFVIPLIEYDASPFVDIRPAFERVDG
jgi:uncharacterized Fe-S cluster-containing radical SAM superfamily protein